MDELHKLINKLDAADDIFINQITQMINNYIISTTYTAFYTEDEKNR